MKIALHKNFEKEYKKLNKTQKEKFKKRAELFLLDPYSPILNNHTLNGKYKGYRSINIMGDIRAVYKIQPRDLYLFMSIGSHSKLYP